MKITEIKQQIKRADRYSIYLDGKYSFSLSELELAKLGLRTNQEITKSELDELRDAAKLDKAYDRVLRYLAIRPRSHWEIEQYLKKKGYEDELAAQVFDKLEPLGLVDDTKFGQTWVEWRLNSGSRSKLKLRQELLQKRLNKAVIDEVLAEVDDDTELEQLTKLIERKKRLSQYQDKQKLIAYLARQGFSYSLIKRALSGENAS